jgi:hypothetical protein
VDGSLKLFAILEAAQELIRASIRRRYSSTKSHHGNTLRFSCESFGNTETDHFPSGFEEVNSPMQYVDRAGHPRRLVVMDYGVLLPGPHQVEVPISARTFAITAFSAHLTRPVIGLSVMMAH